MDWLFAAPLVTASLHMTEEFLLPGGFPEWYRRYTPDPSRITRKSLLIINGLLLLVCADIISLGRTRIGLGYWLVISALLASNGCWHAWASYRSRTYSPGIVTGIALYVPMAIYGYWQILSAGWVPISWAASAALVGGSFPLWSALFHRRFKKPV